MQIPQTVYEAVGVTGAILRRPVALCRAGAPTPVRRHGASGLPGFLRSRPDTGGQRDIWKDGGAPVDIVVFDARTDILSLTFYGPYPLPRLSLKLDEERCVTTIMANGKAVAVLRDAGSEFTLANSVASRQMT